MTNKFIEKIESSDLRCDLIFASTPLSLLDRIAYNPVVLEIQRDTRADYSFVNAVFERATEIYLGQFERNHLHPEDFILATYIYLLSRCSSSSIQRFVKQIACGKYIEFRAATWIAQIVAKKMVETTAQETGLRPSLIRHRGGICPTAHKFDTVDSDEERLWMYVNKNQQDQLKAA